MRKKNKKKVEERIYIATNDKDVIEFLDLMLSYAQEKDLQEALTAAEECNCPRHNIFACLASRELSKRHNVIQ